MNTEPNPSKFDNRSESIQKQLADYEKLTFYYYKNAKEYFKQKEYSKAGEALWGSINIYLKIISLIVSNKPLPAGHKEIRLYVQNLANSLRDHDLYMLYKKAEKLHANFYQNFLDEEEFIEYFNFSEQLLKKIYGLIRASIRKKQ